MSDGYNGSDYSGYPWLAVGLTHKERKKIYADLHDGDDKYWNHPDDYRNKAPEDKIRYNTRFRAINEFEEMLTCHGITRYRFGQIIGIHGATIKKYLTDTTQLRVSHIEKLAAFMGVEAQSIFKLINEDYARVLHERGEYEKYWLGITKTQDDDKGIK